MSGNHFLRSMEDPISHDPERANSSNEVHFADTVSVVTEVNKIAEAPLVDEPLELTTKDDTEAAKANEQIRRSASRDREMRDEEGLALKADPREASEDPPTATNDVAEGVEKLDISSTNKKRKPQDETEQVHAKGNNGARKGRKPGEDRDNGPSKNSTRRGSKSGSKRRNSVPSQTEPQQELRRSKRRKSTSSQ